MRVVAAPDKFKGTLSAEGAARAIAAGWLRTRPGDQVDIIPMADGGEGTLEALLAALDGEVHEVRVAGPLGHPVDAAYGVARVRSGTLAIVEMARASGLQLVPAQQRDPMRASTRGTGELIRAACSHSPSTVILCIGGSATNDGGAGMAQALGVRLRDERGDEIPPGGLGLLELRTVDLSALSAEVGAPRYVVARDVDNPLFGPSGASAIYGPQKGASPEQVILLDRALRHFAAVLERDLGLSVSHVPGAGAAGGLGAGLIAFLGAKLRPGVQVVTEAVGLRRRLAGAGAVITGEGSFDEQSLHGKAAMGVVGAAREVGIPAAVLCGKADVHPEGLEVRSLTERFGFQAAITEVRSRLEALSSELAADWPQD